MTDSLMELQTIQDWLGAHGVSGRVERAERLVGGQSNPTFKLITTNGNYVLRRKPPGPLLPKAHMIEREYRVMSALAVTDVPIAPLVGFCEDEAVIGSAFYVMEFVEGRIFWDARLPGMEPAERAAIFDAMNAAVAALHAVDPDQVGLGDYGRREGFMARQMALWTRQYLAAETVEIPAMNRLIEELPERLPTESATAIFHGDLRMDNMIFHPTEPRVQAMLDWELSTIGDPAADLAYHMMTWRISPELFRGLAGTDHQASGIPDERTYLAAYLARTGRADIPGWNAYLAFGMFRAASILQGVAKRALQGNANGDDAAALGTRVAPLAELALATLRAD